MKKIRIFSSIVLFLLGALSVKSQTSRTTGDSCKALLTAIEENEPKKVVQLLETTNPNCS